MTVLKQSDSKKWIQGLLAIFSVIIAYILVAFFAQLGEWFDLEAKIPYFNGLIQGSSVLLGIATFFILLNRKSAYLYLEEVYGELLKVIWPDKDSTIKLTIGIIVGIIITSVLLGVVDFGIGKMFRLLYN